MAVDEDEARAAAMAVDEKVAAGVDPGPLAGIPIGVKDLEDAADFVTTHGSPASPRPTGPCTIPRWWPAWWRPDVW